MLNSILDIILRSILDPHLRPKVGVHITCSKMGYDTISRNSISRLDSELSCGECPIQISELWLFIIMDYPNPPLVRK